MANAVVEMQNDMRQKVEERTKERDEKDAKLLRQKSLGMEMRQQARLNKMGDAQEREKQQLQDSQESEFAALVDAQAAEVHELQETVTGMIALGVAWVPVDTSGKGTLKPWMVQLKKNRFRSSWKLSELQTHIDKLVQGTGQITPKIAELQRQAELLLKRELQEWKTKLMTAALGEHTSSILSQLVASQKVSQTKMIDHHTQRLRLAEKQSAATMR